MGRLSQARVALIGVAALVAGCTGTLGGDDPGAGEDDGTTGTATDELAAPLRLRRLLSVEYTESVRYLLGDAAALAAETPTDASLNGFDSIAAAQLALGDSEVKTYEDSARAVAAAAMGDADRIAELLGCVPTGVEDSACHEQFVRNFGRLAFRRTLSEEEVTRYVDVAHTAAVELGDFYAGVEYATATLLQSPNFLYQIEIGEPDPDEPGRVVLTGPELATRLSFVLLDRTPSAELLDLAEGGELASAEGLRAAAESMIEQPEARAAIGSFYDEVFKLRAIQDVAKDPTLFPEYTDSLAEAMRQETLTLIDHVVFEEQGSFLDVFDADYTFVNAELAAFYGVSMPPGEGFQRVALPTDQGRGGLMGQAAVLATLAHTSTTSPTLRGKFVRETLLCQSIPAPPNNVITALPPDTEAKTMREKLIQHQEDPSCAGCHVLMDNIGLGLEQFDSIGRFRTTENGVTIDPSADVDGAAFAGPAELGAVLKSREDVAECVVRNIFRGALAHVEIAGEEPAIASLSATFSASGYRMKELLVELVSSDSFRFAAASEVGE